MKKVLSLEESVFIRERLKAEGKTLVLTNGHFDLLHVGHVRCLQQAKRLGDVLVVGLNSDASTRALKGAGRPLVPQDEQAWAIGKLADVPVEIITPSHGLIWREQPQLIVELYQEWAEYATGKTEAGTTLIYGSMYGNTEAMMNAVAQGISRMGVSLEIFDAARTDVSYILPSLWTQAGVMVGAPTYEGTLFPPVAQVLEMAVLKRLLNKKVAMFGSYGWSGGAPKHLKKIIEPVKWELVDSFEFAGKPTEEDLKRGEEFGARFAELTCTEPSRSVGG